MRAIWTSTTPGAQTDYTTVICVTSVCVDGGDYVVLDRIIIIQQICFFTSGAIDFSLLSQCIVLSTENKKLIIMFVVGVESE